MTRFRFKAARLAVVALATLCLTGCPEQDNNPTKHGSQDKPHYDAFDGDHSIVLMAFGAMVIGAAVIYRRKG